MSYKISRSLNGDKIVWIARFKKTVVARANSEKDLKKLLAARDQNLKKKKLKKRKKKLISSDSKSARKRKKRKRIRSKLKNQVQKRKQTLNAQAKNPKKSFWGKSA